MVSCSVRRSSSVEALKQWRAWRFTEEGRVMSGFLRVSVNFVQHSRQVKVIECEEQVGESKLGLSKIAAEKLEGKRDRG